MGKIADYFYRVEYQQKRSPRIHMLIWLENAPAFGVVMLLHLLIQSSLVKNPPKIWICLLLQTDRFIDIPCKRKSQKVCHFNYPQPPTRSTEILYPLDIDMDDNEEKQHKDLWKYVSSYLNDMKEGEHISR